MASKASQVSTTPQDPKEKEASCCVSLVSYPAHDNASERMLRWKVREGEVSSKPDHVTCFHLFDDGRRIEVLKSGVYRLQLYLEPVDSDVSKYYLEVNGVPLPSHHCVSSGSTGYGVGFKESSNNGKLYRKLTAVASSKGDSPIRQDVTLKVANVFDVRLEKWDMVLVRRKSNWIGQYGGRTAFGRLLLQPLLAADQTMERGY